MLDVVFRYIRIRCINLPLYSGLMYSLMRLFSTFESLGLSLKSPIMAAVSTNNVNINFEIDIEIVGAYLTKLINS